MSKLLFTFPGQGAQVVNMLHQLPKSAESLLSKASSILEEDVFLLDTEEALKRTRAVQLCILIASVATAQYFIKQKIKPDFVTGLSIGAFPAAVISGAIAFEDALKLVSIRGALMEKAYPKGYGLVAIGGLPEKEVEKVVAKVHTDKNPAYLANFNAVDQFIVAGAIKALDVVIKQCQEKGATTAKRLAVSVPSHCPLLAKEAEALFQVANQIPFHRPEIAYLSGTTGRVLWQEDKIKEDICFNMARALRFVDALQAAYERGVRLVFEMPPGSVLTGLAKRVMIQGEAIACYDKPIKSLWRSFKQLKSLI